MDNGQIQVIAERSGAVDGFQRLIYTVDPSGETVGLLQQVYDNAGNLVHEHDKLTDIITK